MTNLDAVIDVLPVETEIVSPGEFLRLTRESPSLVKHSRIVMSPLGSKEFGAFEVTYTRPIYKHTGLKREK